MGERIHNRGSLTLLVDYASANGHHLDTVAILHGIPGANGEIGAVAHTTTIELQPTIGEHFYYARLTQDDGKILWTAPIWVTQEQ